MGREAPVAIERSRSAVSSSHRTKVPTNILERITIAMPGIPGAKKAIRNSISAANPNVKDEGRNERHLSSCPKALERSRMLAIKVGIPTMKPRPCITPENVIGVPGAWTRNTPDTTNQKPARPSRIEPRRAALDAVIALWRPKANAR